MYTGRNSEKLEIRSYKTFVLPIKRKNMSSPSSRMDALSVRPKICKPFECLDNLKIRNSLTKRMTLRMANDMA